MATRNRNMNYRSANRAEQRAVPQKSAQTSRVSVEQQAERLANQIIAERDLERRIGRNGKVYSRFDTIDDVLANNVETVTRGLFSGNTGSLVSLFTSSNLTPAQKSYYQEIFSGGDPKTVTSAASELSIAYGHYNGSGSADTSGNLNNDTPSRAIYKQYAQTLLAPNDKKFTFNNVDSDSIYALNFNRARVREKLDPGNFEITLAEMSGGAAATNYQFQESSSNKFIQIIDDSSLTSATEGEAGLVYNLISGSLDGAGIYNASSPVYYGLLYPQHGIAILNATALDTGNPAGGASLGTQTEDGTEGNNAYRLFASISSSNANTGAGVNGGIQARSSEQVKSTYYFVRAKNAEYNYSNNPTFITGSLGQLTFNSFKNDPQTYITSVGLYNDRRELLAVAKMSQPLLKNYTREALIKVKLDF
jgi:hypothetical protein